MDPYRLGCRHRCVGTHSDTCKITKQVRYLGQVGCLDHLAELAAPLGLEVPVDPQEYEICQKSPTGAKSAFPVYRQALEDASQALEGGQFLMEDVVSTLTLGMRSALELRARMAYRAKQNLDLHHCAPGRDKWLRQVGL